ncbi:MAG: cytochrome c3 family protein [Bacillota bacterium]
MKLMDMLKLVPGKIKFIRKFAIAGCIALVLTLSVYSILANAADTTKPRLTKAEPTSKQLIYLTFDEPIKLNPDPPVSWYIYEYVNNVYNGTVSMKTYERVSSDNRIIRVTLADNVYQKTGNAYPNPTTYKIIVGGVYDMSDNVVDTVYNSAYFDAFTPHGKYSPYPVQSGNSNRMCGQCHVTHSATGYDLLNRITIKKVCFVCHGTVGSSVYKVEQDFYRSVGTSVYSTSMHKSLDFESPGRDLMTCVDCHDPHGIRRPGSADIWPKLLRAKNVWGSVYTSADGNLFCLACHGFGDVNSRYGNRFGNYWTNTGGDHKINPQGFDGLQVQSGVYNSVHYDAVNFAAYLNPSSGTKITCVTCHDEHGSRNTRLVDNAVYEPSYGDAREKLCYKCHNSTTRNTINNIDIQAKFTATETSTVSKHTITNTAFGFSCSSCHGPHTVARRTYANSSATLPSDITNPENTKENWNRATGKDMAGFCNKCHDVTSGQTIWAATNSTSIVPYNVYLPATTFTSVSTGWNKKTYFDASSTTKAGHYNPTRSPVQPAAMCDNCHDPHGSNYRRLTRYGEDPNSAPTSTSGNCLRCHGNVAGSPGANISRLNVYTYGFAKTNRHPTLTTSGKHSDTEAYPIPSTNRHAECEDCHDVHAARPGTTLDSSGSTWGPDGKPHTADDTLPGVLAGVSGISVTTGGTLASPSNTYATKTVIQQVYELCLKCHSPYGYDTAPASSYPYPSGSSQPDIGKQFNPNNYAFHPLFKPGRNQPASNANTDWDGTAAKGNKRSTYDDPFKAGVDSTTNPNSGLDNTFVDGWGTKSLVTCTDCHAVDNSTYDSGTQKDVANSNLPDGPHGSAVKWILRKADPRVQVTLADGTVKKLNDTITKNVTDTVGRPAALNNFCVNCHRADVYGWGVRSYTAIMTFTGLSRFNHKVNSGCIGPDGDGSNVGNKLKSGSEALPGCFNCHGGLEPGGIHGSSMGKGGSGVSERGKRFSNGASWYPGHTLGDASGSGACWNESTVTSSINSCAQHSNKTFTPKYYYTWQ